MKNLGVSPEERRRYIEKVHDYEPLVSDLPRILEEKLFYLSFDPRIQSETDLEAKAEKVLPLIENWFKGQIQEIISTVTAEVLPASA